MTGAREQIPARAAGFVSASMLMIAGAQLEYMWRELEPRRDE